MEKKIIFVVMPFKSELDNVYFAIQNIGKELNCDVIRVDELQTTDKITDNILRLITEATLVVGDVTEHNPNVFYEVGYTFALGKEILLIAKSAKELPFDIKDYHIVLYEDEKNFRKLLEILRKPMEEAVKRSANRTYLTKPLLEMVKIAGKKPYSENLFDNLLEIRLTETVKDLKSWTSGNISVGPEGTIAKGIQIFRNLKFGGFATYLAPISEYWILNKEYLEEGRNTAKKGRHIERAYILPKFRSLFVKELQDLISEDDEWGITTFVAFFSDIAKECIRDFGIWDNEVLCLIDTIETPDRRTEVRGCLFTNDQSKISMANYWKNEILKVSYTGKEIIGELSNIDKNRYLLFMSASIMDDYARMYCKGSYIHPTECFWYHSSWQYLRLLDIVSTPFWHNDFYIESLQQEVITKQAPKILISGAADYAMLQHVHSAFIKNIQLKPEIVILDLCRTALEMCRWYSDQYMNNFSINFVQKDAANTDFRDETFDVVVTDAFLTRFAEVDRKKIVDEWRRILKPKGIVITTIRLNANKGDMGIKATKQDIYYYHQKAHRRLQEGEKLLIPIKKDILEKAKMYAEKIISYPIKSKDEVEKTFVDFTVTIDVCRTQGEIAEETEYARIIARKK